MADYTINKTGAQLDAIPKTATTASFAVTDGGAISKLGASDFDISLTFDPSVIQLIDMTSNAIEGIDLTSTINGDGVTYDITGTGTYTGTYKIRCIE